MVPMYQLEICLPAISGSSTSQVHSELLYELSIDINHHVILMPQLTISHIRQTTTSFITILLLFSCFTLKPNFLHTADRYESGGISISTPLSSAFVAILLTCHGHMSRLVPAEHALLIGIAFQAY
jgi:hypothetical protein